MSKNNPFDNSEEIIGEGSEVIVIINSNKIFGNWYKTDYSSSEDCNVFKR